MQVLTEHTINPAYKRIKYGVRGWLEKRSYEIIEEIAQGVAKPFSEVIIHFGNPQGMGQPPVTFYRQVLALLLYPKIFDEPNLPQDVKDRANRILDSTAGRTISSYTAGEGIKSAREDIASFISRRDGYPAHSDDIFLTSGGSEGIEILIGAIQTHTNEGNGRAGVMIPIPGYSMYQARLLQHNSYQIGYELDEDNNWALDISEMKRALVVARPHCVPRAVVLINPGNPTGQVLTYDNIEEVIKFCAEEKLILIADEVYQDNIYAEGAKFHSCRKVLRDLGEAFSNFQLISIHSSAKGISGECGLRGAYFELVGFNKNVKHCIHTYVSARSCPSTIGQALVALICNPPVQGEESYESYTEEKTAILNAYKRKARITTEMLNSLEGVKCNDVAGAMYAFPRITIPDKAIKEAKAHDLPPDDFYCWQLLEATGLCFIPGHGFDKPGNGNHYYYRMTILPSEDKFLPMFERLTKFHQEFMLKYKDEGNVGNR